LRGRSAVRRGGLWKFLSFSTFSTLTSAGMERIITFHENSKKRQEGLRREGKCPETPPGAGNAPGGIVEHVDARRVRALAADRQGGRQEPHAVRAGQARGRGHGVNRAVEAGAAVPEGALGGGEGGVCERLCRAARRREEREAERREREKKWRERIAREVLDGVGGGDHPEGRPGARPAAEPDTAEAVAELAEYLQRMWRDLGPLFAEVYHGCDESKCLYMNDTVVCTFLVVTMLRCRSRNAADGCRNSEGMAGSMLYLSRQDWWPRDEKFTTACTGTLVYRTRKWDCAKVMEINASLVKRLIKAKFFEKDRVFGTYYPLAVDAVHRDERRNGKGESLTKKEKKTIALEAKLITKTGMAVTVCSESVEPYDDKKEKQDCEINAFKRMAPVLRRLMKKYPLCLVGDALYGCDSVWRICEGYGWKYITTFKEGRMSDVYGNANLLFESGDCEVGDLIKADGKPRAGTMKWAVGVETNAPDRYGINVIWGKVSFVADLTKQGKPKRPYVGMFATNLPVMGVDKADEIFCWGRRRWNIENVFKEQKHGGLGLKHRFVNATNANKTWYYLMQIAWTLWQMFQRGFLLRLEAGCRKMTQFLWCEDMRTYIRHFGCAMLVPRYRLMCRTHL